MLGVTDKRPVVGRRKLDVAKQLFEAKGWKTGTDMVLKEAERS